MRMTYSTCSATPSLWCLGFSPTLSLFVSHTHIQTHSKCFQRLIYLITFSSHLQGTQQDKDNILVEAQTWASDKEVPVTWQLEILLVSKKSLHETVKHSGTPCLLVSSTTGRRTVFAILFT